MSARFAGLTATLLLASLVPAFAQEGGAGLRPVKSSGQLAPGTAPRIRGRRVAVVVHGINPDHADLDPLCRDLKARGYHVVRFVYDDSERLHRSAARLRSALAQIQGSWRPSALRVVAHSMGGLVSRRAMTQDPLPRPPEDRDKGRGQLPALKGPLTLVTVASPFGGFFSANLARMGGSRPVYKDLGNFSKFIRDPGQLAPGVTHVKVESLEQGKKLPSGESDKSVPQKNQVQALVDANARYVYRLELGHVGSVNESGRVPADVRAILSHSFSGRLPRKPAPPEPRRKSKGIIGGIHRR